MREKDLSSQNDTSTRKMEANRRNAQKSTGPRTARGKRHSRLNALRHGWLAETVMQDDPEALEEILNSLRITYGAFDGEPAVLLRQYAISVLRVQYADDGELTRIQLDRLKAASADSSTRELEMEAMLLQRALNEFDTEGVISPPTLEALSHFEEPLDEFVKDLRTSRSAERVHFLLETRLSRIQLRTEASPLRHALEMQAAVLPDLDMGFKINRYRKQLLKQMECQRMLLERCLRRLHASAENQLSRPESEGEPKGQEPSDGPNNLLRPCDLQSVHSESCETKPKSTAKSTDHNEGR